MLRCSRSIRCFASLPSSLTSASSSVASRSFHSSSSLLERQADGSFVSDNPRLINRPNIYNPETAKINKVVKAKKSPKSVDNSPRARDLKRVRSLLEGPPAVPQQHTHTIKHMPSHIRLQFQLEPSTRTLVKGTGVGKDKILDYTSSHVFTRAPWPSYREIVLNRAKHNHTLNPAMLQQLTHLTENIEFNKDITASMILPLHIRTEGRTDRRLAGRDPATGQLRPQYEKTFSAGMDIQALFTLVKDTDNAQAHLSKYFRSLYALAFQMHRIRSPMVMAIDGKAIGAGASIPLQARFRVATENTRISFPQASLGWFPDAGASFLLPRLDGAVGMFLALTGWPVKGFGALKTGLASHYCEADELHRFGRRIGDSSLTYQFAEDTIEQCFGMFSENESPKFTGLPLSNYQEFVDFTVAFFGSERKSVEEIIQALQAHSKELTRETQKPRKQFVDEVLNRMINSSPLSLKITKDLLDKTQFLPLEKCLQLEYRLAQKLLCDLTNPLTSPLFNAPNFQQKTLKDVTDEMITILMAEHTDQSKELLLNYPEKKQPTWYI